MTEPAWKRFVENLKEGGFESRYLDRLYAKLGANAELIAAVSGADALQREIMEEMAYALRRAEDKVDVAMLRVEVAAAAVHENRDPQRHEELVVEYDEQRNRAIRARWEFMVHREAIGLIKHDVLNTLYPIPPAIERVADASSAAHE